VRKRKGQYYIQIWHGGLGLKKVEKAAQDKLPPIYVKNAIQDSRMADLFAAESEWTYEYYRTDFWYDGEILELGSPRNDIIINKNAGLKEKVFEYFGIDQTRKLVLYAPTFRADYSNDAYSLDFHRLKHSCEQKFGGNFSVLVRLHPNIVKNCDQMNFDNVDVINASFYPDMQELLSVSDAVISDYSSLMFDFALSMKPCFQFATDIDEYKKDRDFYFEIDNLPFVLAKNNDELEQGILDFDEEKYKSELASFYESVGMVLDGTASLRCSEIILEKCYGKYPV
jgi:CDP-glycerol glycerophosphotransferase